MNELLIKQAQALLEDETYLTPVLANLSALIYDSYETLNWVGFYLYKDEHLILGPFQGKLACTHLYPGKGVCSYAIETKTTQNIADVHSFPTHIACDSNSESELVVPIFIDGKPFGVLDIDAPIKDRFTQEDEESFEALIEVLISWLEEHSIEVVL